MVRLTGLTERDQVIQHGLPVADVRAVPAHVAELMLALPQAELGSLPDGHYRIRPTLTDGPLTGSQAGDLVADDVST